MHPTNKHERFQLNKQHERKREPALAALKRAGRVDRERVMSYEQWLFSRAIRNLDKLTGE